MDLQQRSEAVLQLDPITDIAAEPDIWQKAVWIGQVEDAALVGINRLVLAGADRFERARLLVWGSAGQPRGFLESDVVDGEIDALDLSSRIDDLPVAPERIETWSMPPISVVVCTRDRPDQLRDVLANLVALQYPCFEIVVVDNNPSAGLTAPVVGEFNDVGDKRIRLVDAPLPGLSRARNIGVNHSTYDIVAFTDDDVVVDGAWLRNIAFGFSQDERVVCVCGMVPSAELLTPAQAYFDRRVGWARKCDSATYELAEPPADDPLFPMRVSQFGTGANFAMKREPLIEMGGFDEGLGVGSPTGGGEDIDIFLRSLLADHLLVRESSAVVWHRHRRRADELSTQVHNYGLGLGAWIAKLATRPKTLGMAARRTWRAFRHLNSVTVVDQGDTVDDDPALAKLGRHELRAVFEGPFALAIARYSGRRAYPLIADADARDWVYDSESDVLLERDNPSANPKWLALAAILLGGVGLLALASRLPMAILSIALAAYVVAGPGSLAMSWYTRLPKYAVVTLIPALSLAISILGVTGPLLIGYYDPKVILICLMVLTMVVGLARYGYLVYRNRSAGDL